MFSTLSYTFPIPYGWSGVLSTLTPLVVLFAITVSVWVSFYQRKRHLKIGLIIASGLLLFGSWIILDVLSSDYMVRYSGQIFGTSSKPTIKDIIVVTLPLERYGALTDYYPGGKKYRHTPGLQARDIFEEGVAKESVQATKRIYALSYLLFIASSASLFTMMVSWLISLFTHKLQTTFYKIRKFESNTLKKKSMPIMITQEHSIESLDDLPHKEFLNIVCKAVDNSARLSKTQGRKAEQVSTAWDGTILRDYINESVGDNHSLFIDGFGTKDVGKPAPIKYTTFSQISGKGLGPDSTKKIFVWASACANISLVNLLEGFASHYLEEGKDQVLKDASQLLLECANVETKYATRE